MATTREPLVGRQRELAFLRDRLAGARAGSGRLVLVCGPAGIGKTRLVEELVADGPPVAWGAAIDDAGMPALWPWTRALRGLPTASAAVASVIAGGRESGSAEDAAAATFAADTGVVDALDEQARAAGGLLVVLDDLQWADGATLRLLERVAAEARRAPMLIVGMHREPTAAHASTEVLSLGPLAAHEAAGLLSAAVERADPAAVRRAADLSGGSPLYLRTLARVAAEQLRGRAAWDGAVGEAPELRHLVAAAMRAAGPEAAGAVAELSVLGQQIPPELAARLLGVDSPSAASQRLLPAVPAGLVELPSPANDQFRFAHALVRDAVYASLGPAQRADLHRRAAELLEPLAVGRDERAGAIARHWHRAGEPRRAVEWAVRAADAARAAADYDDATSYLELAIDNLDETDGAGLDRAELLLDLARVEYLAGRVTESLRTCQRAAEEGERTGRPAIIARAAIIVQGVGHTTVNVQLEELCRRALTLLGEEGAPDLRARVEAQLACALLEMGTVDEAAGWSRRALADATASGDPNAELDAIRARAAVQWLPGRENEMFELGGRAIELAEPTGRPLARLWAHVWRSDSAINRTDLAVAQREVNAMESLADRTGLPMVRWHVLRRRASIAALSGSFERCRQLAAQAAEIAAAWQDDSVRYTHFGQLLCLALLRGDPADLAPGWPDYLDALDHMPPVGHAGVAAALMLDGRPDEARMLYQPVIRTLSGPRHGLAVASLAYLVELTPVLGDAAECRALRDLAETLFDNALAAGAGTVSYQGSTARMIAELDLAGGEPAAAVPRFEEGIRVDTLLGARPYVARGRFGLARALLATGDPAHAVGLARAAAADARRLDMPGLVRAADTFLAEASAKARAADPLTPREREIAGLVAQALPNKEIARRLVLSERTVESHISRILAKTGHTTRTELTRWYLQQQPDIRSTGPASS